MFEVFLQGLSYGLSSLGLAGVLGVLQGCRVWAGVQAVQVWVDKQTMLQGSVRVLMAFPDFFKASVMVL